MNERTRLLFLVLSFGLPVVAAACGSSDDDGVFGASGGGGAAGSAGAGGGDGAAGAGGTKVDSGNGGSAMGGSSGMGGAGGNGAGGAAGADATAGAGGSSGASTDVAPESSAMADATTESSLPRRCGELWPRRRVHGLPHERVPAGCDGRRQLRWNDPPDRLLRRAARLRHQSRITHDFVPRGNRVPSAVSRVGKLHQHHHHDRHGRNNDHARQRARALRQCGRRGLYMRDVRLHERRVPRDECRRGLLRLSVASFFEPA